MYRYMMTNARRSGEPVGFLDPHVVSEQTIEADASYVEDYVADSLLTHRNKQFILLPYNQE